MDQTGATRKQGIQSLELAITILDVFKVANGSLTITELSKITKMSKSKLHKYLVSFTRTGVLIQNNKDSTYSFGPKLIELGLTALGKFDVVSVAGSYIAELRDLVDQSTALAIWNDGKPMLAKFERSSKPIHVEVRTGLHLSFLTTAIGKCFAAFNESDSVKNQIEYEIAHYNLNKSDVETELASIRQNHIAFRKTAFTGIPGSMAMASPIFDYSGAMVGAISVIGFSEALEANEDSKEVILLKETARKISNQLS